MERRSANPAGTRVRDWVRSPRVRHKEELSAVNCRPLHVKQLALAIDAPAVAGQVAAGSDHTMARDQKSHPVGGAGSSDCTSGVGVAQFAGELAVAAGLAAGNLSEGLPHAELKHGATEVERADAVAAVQISS